MSVVEELRQNDLAKTCICIRLHGETSDAALAQALEQNPFVTDIILNLDGVQQRANWNSLLRVIAMRANLETVSLHDATSAGQRNAPAVLIHSFLRAIQQNGSIRSIELVWLRLPIDILSTFVDTASSITSFKLYDCDMEAAEREQGARSLAVALQRNTNIERLELNNLEDIYAIPMLEGLRSNVSLKTFVFKPCGPFLDAASSSIQHLLESTTSIQRFELQEVNFWGGRLFRPIAQGISSSGSVSELKIEWCQFEDRESFAQLQGILQNKQNLSSLCLHYCDFGGGRVHGDIVSILSRPDSLLRCLDLQGRQFTFPGIHFKNLLQAIEKSMLERFNIGTIQSQYQFQTLVESIPSMKLKELEIDFWDNEGNDDEDEGEGEFDEETIRQDLLHAVKNNFSLRSLKAKEHSETDLFNNDDKQTLAFYANRNESLDQWVDKPEIVEQHKVWPDALNLAQKAGPDALFRGLRSVLESDYGSLPGGRKRKRPQFYTPA